MACLKIPWLLNLLLFIIVADGTLESIGDGHKHLVFIPARFLSGYSNKVCLSRFDPLTQGIAFAHVELLTVPHVWHKSNDTYDVKPKYIAKTKKKLLEGNGGCLDIFIPRTQRIKAKLHFYVRFEKFKHYSIDYHREILIQHDASIVVIQTDKQMYRTGEEVKFRVIQLKNDLTPMYSTISYMYIMAPYDLFGGLTKVAEWSNISTHIGTLQKEYQLDEYASKGEWKIIVKTRDPNMAPIEQSFIVADYMLPNYNIIVDYKKNIFYNSKKINWSICVRHAYGEGVEGVMLLKIKTDQMKMPIEKTLSFGPFNPCKNYTISSTHLKFTKSYSNGPRIVIADLAFQETGMRMWKNVTTMSYLKKDIVKINFIHNRNLYFKPGLPQFIKIYIDDWDENPIANAQLLICIKKTYSKSFQGENLNENCGLIQTNRLGIVDYSFIVLEQSNIDRLNIKVSILFVPGTHIKLDSKNIVETLELSPWPINNSTMYMEMEPLISPYHSNSSVNSLPILLTLKSDRPIKHIILHYMIITKSGTIQHWGITSQCMYPFDGVNNMQILTNTDCTYHESNSGIYKTILHIKINHKMCPHSDLIAYFMNDNGEFVSASEYLEINECFPNKFSHKWIQSTVEPSTKTKLALIPSKNNGLSLCFTDCVDVRLKSVMNIRSMSEDILHKLNDFIYTRIGAIEIDVAKNKCWMAEKNDINTISAMSLFAGVYLLNSNFDNCSTININQTWKPGEMISSKRHYNIAKTFFPETWLWGSHFTDSKSVSNIPVQVPDEITTWESQVFCISRSGIAISNNQRLKVFKPIFVDFLAPKSIKRGEDVRLSFKVHNYLLHDVPINLHISAGPKGTAKISFLGKSKHPKPICLTGKRIHIEYFKIRASELTQLNVSVAAMIVNDLKNCAVPVNLTSGINDRIIKEITVVPEGVKTESRKSVVACLNDSSAEITWNFKKDDYIDGSEKIVLSIIGDMAGPMDINLDTLLSLPIGCGEQNMVVIAYNLLALRYKTAKKQISGHVKELVLNNLLLGYQRQLKFRHSITGSFSMFGNVDKVGSIWLTTFCIKHLSLLQSTLKMYDRSMILKASEWVLSFQLENGCFPNVGIMFHEDLMGGIHSKTPNIALTAFIAISLLDAGISIPPLAINSMLYCLGAVTSANSTRVNDTYTTAIVSYALLKIQNEYNTTTLSNNEIKYLKIKTEEVFQAMKKSATVQDDLLWWNTKSFSTTVEATAYGILSLLKMNRKEDVLTAMAAIKWLSTKRNHPMGGFVSTQDTIVAMEAVSAYRNSIVDVPPSLNVQVQSFNGTIPLVITPLERYKLHSEIITINNTNVSNELIIKAYGSGCILIQATYSYNKRTEGIQASPFQLYIEVFINDMYTHAYEEVYDITIEVCIGWNDVDVKEISNLAVLKINLLPGHKVDRYLLYQSIGENNPAVKRIEESTGRDGIYAFISLSETVTLIRRVCVSVNTIGPKLHGTTASVSIVDYYRTEMSTSTVYEIPH